MTTEVPKLTTPNRRARMSSGLTGLSVEFLLIHLQNMSILRDEAIAFLESEGEATPATHIIGEMRNVLDFIVQQDFPSPIAKGLWDYDHNESLQVSKDSFR